MRYGVVSEKFIIKKKRGDPALKVTDDGRGQLGHLKRELVPVLACFPVLIVIYRLSVYPGMKLIWVFAFESLTQ